MVTKGSFDIIQAENLHVAQYCLGLKAVTILDLLGIESSVMKRYADMEHHSLKRVYAEITSKKLAEYEREVCGRFTHCLVCSEEDRRLLQEATGVDNASLIPNGVDVETFSPDGVKTPQNNRIVFVGRMDYHANVDGVRWFCDEVLPMVRDHSPDVLFQIVGGHPTKEVRRLARPGQVEVTGFVEDVRPYLREATVVVVPLRVGGGTRLKILEALAMGKAIVSTTVGAEGIDLTPERHLLTADQPEEMCHQILRLLKHADLRTSLSKAGRSLVEERYSWKAIGQRLEHVYERCLQRTLPSRENLQNVVSPRSRSGHRLPKL
jgi:sugar transferase (PEP-CTERM/EpsH1 system associated)